MPSHYGGNGRMNGNGRTTTRSTATNNPVTSLFNAPTTPRYYRPDGSIVPVGSRLHLHQDGTIMTEHSMGPRDNSVVVTTTQRNMRNSTPRQTTNNSSGYVIQSTGAPYHGRVLSHGGELYSTHTGALEGNSQILTRVSPRSQRMNQTITNMSGTRNPNSSRRMMVGTSPRRRTRRPINNGRTMTPRTPSNMERQRTQRTASTQMRRSNARRGTTMRTTRTPMRTMRRRGGGGGGY